MSNTANSSNEITGNGSLERAISASSWVENLIGDNKRTNRVNFRPLQTTVTYDAEKITPGESVVFIKRRSDTPALSPEDFVKSEQFKNCSTAKIRAVTSIRAASEIMDSIASISLLQYSIYSNRNLIPLFLSPGNRNEFGGKVIRRSMLKRCFSRTHEVDSLLEELEKRKTNAAKAFAHAVREKSAVNAALAAWSAGNAANLQHLVQFSRIKYGPGKTYNKAGIFSATHQATKKSITSSKYMAEIKNRHKGSLNFDSAASIFNTALARIFSEFKTAVDNGGNEDPLFSAVRQRRRNDLSDGLYNFGMLAPRENYTVADYIEADNSQVVITKPATEFENLRGGNKRKADTETEDLKDTLAKSIADSALDATTISTTADLQKLTADNFEWSMHITQLFAQAFLEAMSSSVSCSFGIEDALTNQGMEAIAGIIRKQVDDRYVDMNPSVLADEYLLFAGNFQVAPFKSSDPNDIVEGRQVCPNTPILSIVTHYNTADRGIVSDIELRDRLLVKDEVLNQAIANTLSTPVAERNKPTDVGASKMPMLAGCLPVIRGPLAFRRDSGVEDVVNSLANDWYITTGVYHSIGKTSAAICAGYQRAIATTKAITNSASLAKNKDKKLKKSMRRNTDRFNRIVALLGQTVSEWSHQEHNSTLDSFWSSAAAVRSKAFEDALSRSEIDGVRKQLDGKCSNDEFLMAEHQLRNSFFNAVSQSASYDIDSIANFPDEYSRFSEWFDKDTSGTAINSWKYYEAAMSKLPEYERQAFNVQGLFSAIKNFKFPLVAPGTKKPLKKRHRIKNLKAANRVINGVTEMILQSAFNGVSTSELGMGIGSAADGWGPGNNQLEPSRMKALKLMAKFGKQRPDVISIPISRSRGSISGLEPGITSVNIPAVIMSHLVSDKKILDDLCGGGMNLAEEIKKFIQNLSGVPVVKRNPKTAKNTSSILTTGKHSIMLLRYMWFNTAVISLTDSNIKTPLNISSNGLGDSLYRDYLAIRSLVSNYNKNLSDFSINAISAHYACDETDITSKTENITINTESELLRVLQQTTNVLLAFTNIKDGNTADSQNMANVIKPIGDIDTVKKTVVTITGVSNAISLTNFFALLKFLYDIGKMNTNLEEPLRRFALGKSLTREEMGNYVQPDITKVFEQELGIQGAAMNNPLGAAREVKIDLNEVAPLMIKTNAGYATERIAAITAIPPNNQTTAEQHELRALASEVNLQQLPSLVNKIKVAGFITPAVAINIVNVFTRDGRFSNKNSHMNVLIGTIESIQNFLEKNINYDNDSLVVNVEEVGEFIQNGLLFCFICVHSHAGRYIINPVIKDFSKLLSDIAAETSLAVSRLQSSFYTLPPTVFSLTGMFKPDKNLFDEMTKNYFSEIVEHLTTVTSNAMSEHCNDNLSSAKIFKAGENYNSDQTPTGAPALNTTAAFNTHLKNPAAVWSPSALPHFDVAVVPKQLKINSDQLLRLSSYYQGMHKMSMDPGCAPQSWDMTLAGNMAGKFFGLRGISDNNRSFNSALDALLTSPAEICDIISRETVRTSNDVIHNVGSAANKDKIQKLLQQGRSAVKSMPASQTTSPTELYIKETISALSKNSSTSEGYATAKEIVRTWNTLSLTNHGQEVIITNKFDKNSDVVRAPLLAVPSFRQNVVEATKSVYELASVCSVMSKDDAVRSACRKVMGTIEETSPVIHDIGISRVAGLVSTVASPKKYRKFLRTIADHRNSLLQLVNVNPLSNNNNSLQAVYDGLLYKTPVSAKRLCSSSTASLPDRFWMGVFNECLKNTNVTTDSNCPASSFYYDSFSAPAAIYGSRVNTYAALSTRIDRLKDSMAAVEEERRDNIKKGMAAIENYIVSVAADNNSPLSELINAQSMYTKLSDITANSIYSDYGSIKCGIAKNTAGMSKSARQQSDSILRATLHELASALYDKNPGLANQLALACHISIAKGLSMDLNKPTHKETFKNLLSVAGVTDYAHVSANALCRRLKSEDIKMFLGGTMLQQGLFVTFLLNNVLFAQLSNSVKMEELTAETKSILVKLIGFCETLSDALNTRHARRKINMTAGGRSFATEEAKVDASFASAIYSAYKDLALRSDSTSAAEIFGDRMMSAATIPKNFLHASIRGPQPKRSSTLSDILEAPSTVQKTFMTSFPEKAAASRQARCAAGSLMLSSNKMESIYGKDILTDMRESHRLFMDNDCSDFDEFSEDERMSISSQASSSSSESDIESESSDDGFGSSGRGGRNFSYDAVDRLKSLAAPLISIYGCEDDSDFNDEDDSDRLRNTALGGILRDIGESDAEFEDDDDFSAPGTESENAIRRRSERIQFGPGFLSHSFLFNHPAKTRAFLTRGKKYRPDPGQTSWGYFDDDDAAIFSDEYTSDSETEEILCGGRRRRLFKRRGAEDQCAFIRRVLREFVPSKISLINGRVSLITPVGTDTAAGFIETYQKANKKERENLRKKFDIAAADDISLPAEYLKGSRSKISTPRELRRSLIKASAYVTRTQTANAEKIYTAIVADAPAATILAQNPSNVLSETILFSKELKGIIDTKNRLLKNLADVSSSLFTSSIGQGPGGSENALEKARELVTHGESNRPGYLGVPLRNLAGCLRRKAIAPSGAINDTGISVDSLLAITDRNHLDWMTSAAIVFARAFNLTTFYAVESTLKTTVALGDMYNAFAKLVSAGDKEKIPVKSTLLDSMFNTRMAHLEAVLGLVCPTAFINHEMPSDSVQRKKIQSLALTILRGINSNQLPSNDIGDTSGLLAFLTSTKFAGREGERGGLSLYRMSVTDSLSSESPENRLKGAVSLEVGKWKMCSNSVFSKRSKDLVDYCSQKFLSLENTVGPIARFIPDGTDPETVGLSTLPPMFVSDDPAAQRLHDAEYGCGAAGRFITASAMGNLYGCMDDISSLAKKFTAAFILLNAASENTNINDIAKDIISKMKAHRSKSLKTPFGDTSISQDTNFPGFSTAIVLRAREMKNSITTIVADLSKRHGITSCAQDATNVSVKTFDRILETSAVLANTKTTLMGIENRLAAAEAQLKQFKNISGDGLSESRAVITAVAETMNTLDGDNGERIPVADFMNDNSLFEFIIKIELKNIEDAKRQITAAIEGACQLHAKLLSMLAASEDFDSNSEACQRLIDVKATGATPMTNANCGTILKHPGTGLWLKTDEDCNTRTGADIDHRRIAHSILSVVQKNRNKSLISELHSMCYGKYAMPDIFVIDDSDVKNVDKLVEKLGAALASKASCPKEDVASSSIASTKKEYEYSSSCASMSKKIPYIPIVFENRHEKKTPRPLECPRGDKNAMDEQKAALRQLETQEAIDLSNILSTATKHKFVMYNQAAVVAIFNGSQKAEPIIPEAERKKSAAATQSILTKLPVAIQALPGNSVQLPPSAVGKQTPVGIKLRDYAVKIASDLLSAPEYKYLTECQRKINSAVDRLSTIDNGSFFTSGIRPEIKQSTMTELSQSQSEKEGALELYDKVLHLLEAYTPDPSLSSVSLPVDASSTLPNKKSSLVSVPATDFFDYAYKKLKTTETVDNLEKYAVTKSMVEEESAIRIPLLLSSPQFASILREIVNSFGDYFQRVEKIKQKVTTDAKNAVSSSFKETDKEINADKSSLIPVIDELSKMYSKEADAIKTAIKVIENKKNELELQNQHTTAIIDDIKMRIEAGEVNANVNDMLSYGNKADSDQQFLKNIETFAENNSGVVYTPQEPKSNMQTNNPRNQREDNKQLKVIDSYYKILNDAITAIKLGQEGVTTDYEIALSKFPATSMSYDTLTMQTVEKQQRERLACVEMFIGILANRASKLRARLANSLQEAKDVETKKQKIDAMFRRQIEDRYNDTKQTMGIAESAAHSALAKDISQSAFMMALSGKVDKLLQRLERVGGTLTSSSSSSGVHVPKSVNKSDIDTKVEHIEDPAYSCFMSPFHESIKRITALYNKDRKGPLSNNRGIPTSEADLQLMTIVDLSAAVLNAASGSKYPDMVPSSIVPGLCQLCAMIVTNMHEAVHESTHSFNFEGKRSRKKLVEMLNAVTSGSDNPRIRHNVLAMLEANNGHIKEFSFTQKQKVACVTPVNTLLGGTFNGDIAPNTVLLPTSELFSCPGLDNDKFRSMVHRSVDKTVADAPKSSASIVETLARTAPNAENLFFPFKDQRRHFNSITDAIISNMSSEASSLLNTTCDQNLVEIDKETGFTVFVGRSSGKSRMLETELTSPIARGGMPGCTSDRSKYVDMGVKFMVAPGSLLNANKEETLRLNRLSDINNVMHYGTDVHVAGANSAWRIGEVIRAASASSKNETISKRLLLLGSVSAVSAQKSAQYNNDPTAFLNTASAIQNLVSEAFPSPISMAVHAGAAESAFATQLAYRHRLFPSNGTDLSSSACPMDILGKIRRYSESYNKTYPYLHSNAPHFFKQSIANVPLHSISFDEETSAASNRIFPFFNSQDSSAVNRLSVQAMTDTVVDTLSAVATMVGRQNQRNKLPPSILSIASTGKPLLERNRNTILGAISRISRDASLLSQINEESFGDGLSSSSLSAFLKASNCIPSTDNNVESQKTAAETVLGAILDGARETSARLERLGVRKGGSGRAEVNALYRNAMTSILQLNEDEIARDANEVESRIETHKLREAFNELKKGMLFSNGSCSNSLNVPMSALVSRGDVVSGRLALSNNTSVMSAVDEFKNTPLLVRYLMLDSDKSPVPITKEVKGILTQPKAITAHALLSESSPLLTDLCLFNTRDTQPERAIDRLVASAYFVKQAKRFDGVDPLFPAAITGAAHLMLSSMESRCNNPSSFLNNIKLHMNDTTCFLKNIERYERLLGKFGDSYAMSHKQNCNCPFALHHDFRPSANEYLVSSFAFARPEVTVEEIRATPYQANKLLNDKHYVMALSKIDTRVTGLALLKKVSEWTEMRMNVSFNGVFEPSRLALSNSGFTTAGVNLDVIVRPNNAKNVMGILECHRKHICSVDAKSTISATMPAIFQSTSTDRPGNASEIIQNALPRNRYIQKSSLNAHTVIFANVLEQLVCDLGNVIVHELAGLLATSVSESVYADTKSMIDTLGSEALFNSSSVSQAAGGGVDSSLFLSSTPKLVSESMKNAIYQCLISGKATNPENVPFASLANGSIAYDFLLSKESSFQEENAERGAAAAVANMPESSTLRKLLARVFEAISKQVSDAEFGNILDEIEAKIMDESSTPSSYSSHTLTRAFRQEFNKILSFLMILRKNIIPALLDSGGILAEKVAIYLSLLSTKSKLENLLHYGLSNSSSVDLSHLKPINGSNNIKNIEDTFMYRNVHPVLLMALPENFTALLQQEQCDAELAIENRKSITTFLNHPNTTAMATSARASLGAGGGNPLGLYVSSHVLHESTVTTCDPVVDVDSKLSFHSSVTQDPMMVVNPFKETANLKLSQENAMLDSKCNYLQVSMPTEFSGLVTNTGVKSIKETNNTFKFVRRDSSPIYLPMVTPSVLCSDASTNLLDIFSRADVVLNDVNVRFGFMPEIIEALANIKGWSSAEVIKEMSSRAGSPSSTYRNASIDAKTGDVIVKNGTFPDVISVESVRSNVSWGEEEKQKLHARILPTFMVSNPLASASVNGVPITFEGFLLTGEKRKKAAGISSRADIFGSGFTGSGALRAAAYSRLTSDLEPLRKGWESVIKLQSVFSKAAANLKNAMDKSGNNLPSEIAAVANKLHDNYTKLNECREILQNQTSLLVATSDLVTGGYAGDPSAAMISPVHPETTGLIGAISSAPVRGLSHLLKNDGVAAVKAALREKLNLSSSNGRLIPEHGVVHKSSNELLTDADSIRHLYSINNDGNKNQGGNLDKVMTVLGLRGDGGNIASAAKHVSSLLAASEYGNRRDSAKRQGIVHLLISNPVLLSNVSNALFFTVGKNSISPLTAADTSCAVIGGARGMLQKNHMTSNNGSSVESLNRLIGSRL